MRVRTFSFCACVTSSIGTRLAWKSTRRRAASCGGSPRKSSRLSVFRASAVAGVGVDEPKLSDFGGVFLIFHLLMGTLDLIEPSSRSSYLAISGTNVIRTHERDALDLMEVADVTVVLVAADDVLEELVRVGPDELGEASMAPDSTMAPVADVRRARMANRIVRREEGRRAVTRVTRSAGDLHLHGWPHGDGSRSGRRRPSQWENRGPLPDDNRKLLWRSYRFGEPYFE